MSWKVAVGTPQNESFLVQMKALATAAPSRAVVGLQDGTATFSKVFDSRSAKGVPDVSGSFTLPILSSRSPFCSGFSTASCSLQFALSSGSF